nr:unnamed protein product [Digitaria exilis]
MTSLSRLATLGGYLPKSQSTKTQGQSLIPLGWCARTTWSRPPVLRHSGRAARNSRSLRCRARSSLPRAGGTTREWRLKLSEAKKGTKTTSASACRGTRTAAQGVGAPCSEARRSRVEAPRVLRHAPAAAPDVGPHAAAEAGGPPVEQAEVELGGQVVHEDPQQRLRRVAFPPGAGAAPAAAAEAEAVVGACGGGRRARGGVEEEVPGGEEERGGEREEPGERAPARGGGGGAGGGHGA